MYVIKLEQVLCTAYLGVVFTFVRFIKPHQSVKITARLTRIEIVIFFFLRSINSIVVTVAVVVFVVAVVVGAVLFLLYELISHELFRSFIFFRQRIQLFFSFQSHLSFCIR